MTKISSYSLRFAEFKVRPVQLGVATILLASTLASWAEAGSISVGQVEPFGSLFERLSSSIARDPQVPIWRGFDSEHGPNLLLLRVERLSPNKSCGAWISKISSIHESLPAWTPDQSAIGAPLVEEIKRVESCNSFPCEVKLDRREIMLLQSAPKSRRMAEYLSLIASRVERYRTQGVRAEYEFPGAPVDPWLYFKSAGINTQQKQPTGVSLKVRRLDMKAGSLKPFRQVLDVRRLASDQEADVWVRDAYTQHYFDSWGEWHQLKCNTEVGTVLVSTLFMELDMLKQTDFFSLIGRPKMRAAVERLGNEYLDQIAEKFKN